MLVKLLPLVFPRIPTTILVLENLGRLLALYRERILAVPKVPMTNSVQVPRGELVSRNRSFSAAHMVI